MEKSGSSFRISRRTEFSLVPFGFEFSRIRPKRYRKFAPSLEAVDFTDSMAEGEGFEPPVPFQAQRFSRPPVSTAHPSLRGWKASAFSQFSPSPMTPSIPTLSCIPPAKPRSPCRLQSVRTRPLHTPSLSPQLPRKSRKACRLLCI